MNKLLLLLITIFSFGTNITKAQDQKFHFGLKGSPILAWLKPDTKGLKSDGTKLGFSYGIIGEYNFSENYAIASGVQVTYRGGNLKWDSIPNSTTKWNMQYVELPVTIKMKTKEVNKFKYFGQFGFVPGINIRAKFDAATESDLDGKDNIKPINLSMLIAIGAEYTISGTTTILTSLEFNNGFLDAFKESDLIKTDYRAITNFCALNIGVMF
jgi:hypothetical protein